jgi:peptidoglycan hydrolase-like protein with peptidoglycan-binding domain
MKHLLNNISQEEKNRILEQHRGGMSIDTTRFKVLLESTMGNVKPLIMEDETKQEGEETKSDVNLINDLEKIYNKKETFEKQQKPRSVEKGVELLQTALQFLKFSLPKWGVDGKFGPETEKAVTDFQEKYSLDVTGIVDQETMGKIIEKMDEGDFENEDINKIQKNKVEDLKTDNENPTKSEGNILPPQIQKLMDKLKDDWEVEITQKHIDAEFKQEGNIRPDNGGVNSKALTQIKKLIEDCKKANPTVNFPHTIKHGVLGLASGYRSYNDQVINFGKKVKDEGRSVENVQASNCLPGFSQHHTGKTFDLFSTTTSWWDKNSNVKNWVANNCKTYGFKVTYKSKGSLRIAEPWHLYYIGD